MPKTAVPTAKVTSQKLAQPSGKSQRKPSRRKNPAQDDTALVKALYNTSAHMRGLLPMPDMPQDNFTPPKKQEAKPGEQPNQQTATPSQSIAVIIPCHNEEKTISSVVRDFQKALPSAQIYVYDNHSSDETAACALKAGAKVYHEPRPGKGHVVRRMFADIDADIYIMADGDGTYDASAAPRLTHAITSQNIDMVIGARSQITTNAHRHGHAFGNQLFNTLYGFLFGAQYQDIFSGYRAFSRRFVKSFPALSNGFEIETELAVHASQLKLPTLEISLPYGARVEGSHSKLNSLRDGMKILATFALLLKETRPAWFFGALAGANLLLATLLALPLIDTFLATGLVPRLPTAVLCTGLTLLAALFAMCGIILDSLARSRCELKRLLYLAQIPVDRAKLNSQ